MQQAPDAESYVFVFAAVELLERNQIQVCPTIILRISFLVYIFSNLTFKYLYVIIIKYMQALHTAGKAKKDMPNNAHAEAISFPFHVIGTASPYPTVQRVI